MNAKNLRISFGVLAVLFIVAGCSTTVSNRRAPDTGEPDRARATLPPRASPPVAVPAVVKSATVQKLVAEAALLAPLVSSSLAKRFLAATDYLPNTGARAIFKQATPLKYFSQAAANEQTAEARAKLTKSDIDEYRYYYTKYGSPLAYVRALDLVAARGSSEVAGRRILDFGYGSIGHLRLLASLGANVTGIDPDSYLAAIYAEPGDQGRMRGVSGREGNITLAHGYYPKNPTIVAQVGRGYDLILSKNTLKRGYIKPERKVPKEQLVDLGVSDEVFLKTLMDAMNPSAILMIYNLAPAQAAAGKAYLPHADARSPFTREQFVKAGFNVVALDVPDHDFVRRMGGALGWDKNEKGEVTQDLNTNLFALYTMVEKPAR